MRAGTINVSESTIRRPTPDDWQQIEKILDAANFLPIGGEEMPSFPLEDCFVAEVAGRVVGVAGYRLLSGTTAKTTLLAVDPEARVGGEIGRLLQVARMEYLRELGVRTLTTNADDPRVMTWYERRFGYRRTGRTVPKVEPFGRPDVERWTTLEVDLTRFRGPNDP